MHGVEHLLKFEGFQYSPNSFKAPKKDRNGQKLAFSSTFFGQKIKYYTLKFCSIENMHEVESLSKI